MPSYFPPPPFQRVALRLAAALSLVAAPALSAQDQAVAGIVRRIGTLVPIEGAIVQIAGTTLSALTDAAGRFRITGVTGDSVTIQVRRLSYNAVSQRVAANATACRSKPAVEPFSATDHGWAALNCTSASTIAPLITSMV